MTAQLPPGLPATMRAIIQPDRLSKDLVLREVPLPTLKDPDDVLVKVHATCPCAGELLWARGYASLVPADKVPVVSQDLCGRMVAVGANNSSPSFRPGDDVIARIPFARAGCASDYTVAKVRELARKPRTLGPLEAAATPLSALTAWQAVFDQSGGLLDVRGLREEEGHSSISGSNSDKDENEAKDAGRAEARRRNAGVRVLVTGAGGGVGSWVVQLCALAGAGAVVAVCGPDKAEVVRGLGATEVVNYRETSLAAWAAAVGGAVAEQRECHLVIDCVGDGDTLAGCWAAVRDGGVLLSIAADTNASRPLAAGGSNAGGNDKVLARSSWFLVEPLGSNLAEVVELIDAGKLRPAIDSVWGFDEYGKAFARLEDGHPKGKIVIKVEGEI